MSDEKNKQEDKDIEALEKEHGEMNHQILVSVFKDGYVEVKALTKKTQDPHLVISLLGAGIDVMARAASKVFQDVVSALAKFNMDDPIEQQAIKDFISKINKHSVH